MGVLSTKRTLEESRRIFDSIYSEYNKREYVSPDPLQFLYEYENEADREIVGLIASSLAYGRVAQILKSVSRVLEPMGASPCEYLKTTSEDKIRLPLEGFAHRFTDGAEMAQFLICLKRTIAKYGTAEGLYAEGRGENIWQSAENFVTSLMSLGGMKSSFLLPKPSKGSACKRLGLFFRWMARRDGVDPGGWSSLSPSEIFIPLDTHMFNICSTLGLCTRKSADRRAVAEITEAFSVVRPDDPVRYDFALTRFGIRNDMTLPELFARWERGGLKEYIKGGKSYIRLR